MKANQRPADDFIRYDENNKWTITEKIDGTATEEVTIADYCVVVYNKGGWVCRTWGTLDEVEADTMRFFKEERIRNGQ